MIACYQNIGYKVMQKIRLLSFLLLLLLVPNYLCDPFDYIVGRQYHGEYTMAQSGKAFDYLSSQKGEMVAIFYGSPNMEQVNSIELVFFDPKYKDQRVVIFDIKNAIAFNKNGSWSNSNHSATFSCLWREREESQDEEKQISTEIFLQNWSNQDYEEVIVKINSKGKKFKFSAQLTFYDQVLSTLAYSAYASLALAIQIFSSVKIIKTMEEPNFVLTAKYSLLTICICNIYDFYRTMAHIQYVMGAESGSLFFIVPGLASLVLFIVFDMKMLFLIWRSQNLAVMNEPQQLRKKLTSFYIKFYIGLFLFLTLNFFFADEEWMIIASHFFLLPQIAHNIRLGQKPNFSYYYLFGYIGSRYMILIYERGCPENRFKLSTHFTLLILVLFAYLVQVALISLQYRLGSRFFLPKRFLPQQYQYRQKITNSEENQELECVICLLSLVQGNNSSKGTHQDLNQSMISREQEFQVLVAPCNHKFHEECLTRWMEVKLECPTCRKALPPI